MKKSAIPMIFIMLISLCIGCGGQGGSGDETISVYRLMTPAAQNDGGLLTTETVRLKDGADPIDTALDLLQKEPSSVDMQCAIPNTVQITKYNISSRAANVTFNAAYKNLVGMEKTITDYVTVLTLTETGLVDTVSIWSEGELISSNLTSENILHENTAISDDTSKLRLYFPDADNTSLCAEYHTVSAVDSGSMERAILDELLKGPHSPKLRHILPQNPLLLSVSTKDGICTVNFSSEFLANDSLPTETATLNIFSIVNSLSSIEAVDAVQILVDGKIIETVGGIETAAPLHPRSFLSTSLLLLPKQ